MIKRCLFTYKPLGKNETYYSLAGLKQLNARLSHLSVFPYSSKELLKESQRLASKISIQGVQPKLSVQLSVKENQFAIVEKNGTYIVKPESPQFPELPENEDLTMHLASIAKFNVPWHGLIACEDGSRAYVVKRFDRTPRGERISQEDFAQLMEASRATKYEANMGHVAEVIEKFCTFPKVEFVELFRRMAFSFLVGNEDMHLKNFSVLTDPNGHIKLTPVYDFLNSTIALADPQEEFALAMNDLKAGFTRDDFIRFGMEDLLLSEKLIVRELQELCSYEDAWLKLIETSFLSDTQKEAYMDLLSLRIARLSS